MPSATVFAQPLTEQPMLDPGVESGRQPVLITGRQPVQRLLPVGEQSVGPGVWSKNLGETADTVEVETLDVQDQRSNAEGFAGTGQAVEVPRGRQPEAALTSPTRQ